MATLGAVQGQTYVTRAEVLATEYADGYLRVGPADRAETRRTIEDAKKHGAMMRQCLAYLVVTNDGVRWTAIVTRNPSARTGPIGFFRLPGGTVHPQHKLPLEWARRTIRAMETSYETDAAKLSASRSMPFPGILGPLGDITYVGWPSIERRSAHALADLHGEIGRACLAAASVWNWEPRGLEISFHESGRTFGLAFDPGGTSTPGKRMVSLNHILLEKYDLESAGRVVRHELCHHYRGEMFKPRPTLGNAHDAIFCRELARIDPVAGESQVKCRNFTDEIDPAAMQASGVRRSGGHAVVWSPDAGYLSVTMVNGRRPSFAWTPLKGGKWRAHRVGKLTSDMLFLFKQFGPQDWPRVKIVPKEGDQRAKGYAETVGNNLLGLAKAFVRYTPNSPLRAYLVEVLGV